MNGETKCGRTPGKSIDVTNSPLTANGGRAIPQFYQVAGVEKTAAPFVHGMDIICLLKRRNHAERPLQRFTKGFFQLREGSFGMRGHKKRRRF
jgi:hypothetical protein